MRFGTIWNIAVKNSSRQTAGRRACQTAAGLALLISGSAFGGDSCDTWSDLDGGITVGGGVSSLLVHNGELIAGGFFGTAGGQTVNHIARWNGVAWQPYIVNGNIGVSAPSSTPVTALTVLGDNLVIGGNFTLAGGQLINRVAWWDEVNQTWENFGSGMNLVVTALTVYNGELVAGGDFGSAGGQAASRIARWDGANWQPFIVDGNNGVNARVNSMIVHNGELIIGGDFTTAGGQTVNRIARWDAGSGTWQPFVVDGNIGMSGPVRALAVHDGDLIAGGIFATAGGVTVNNVARWDGTAWQPLIGSGGDAGVSGGSFPAVQALATYNGDLIVGGLFRTADGQTVDRIARWDGSQWLPFDVAGNIGVNSQLSALAVYGDLLVAGGVFLTAGGQTVNGVASWLDCFDSTPGDVNGDGIVNVIDLLAVLGAWGACPEPCPGTPCPADANDDCVVNVEDLLTVLGNWG